MSHGIATAERQAELLREKGNQYFQKERIGAAIDAYTEAITLCPNVAVYWTNRALCYRKKNDWEHVESDCRKALELDKDSVKAHYYLGRALLQRQVYGDAIRQLEKALELGRGGKPGNYMVEDIWQDLATAKFTEWEQAANYRRHKQQEVKRICEALLRLDYLKRVKENSERAEPWRPVEIDGIIHLDDNESVQAAIRDGLIDPPTAPAAVTEEYREHVGTLRDVFDRAAAPDNAVEIPDHLQCKITMDIFRDPVITPSGVTYERAILLEHLRKVGKFDPLTRAPLQPEQIAPNLAIKEAVQTFLREHGWAYKTT